MRRREFIALFTGITGVFPSDVRAQPTDRVRRIGVLMSTSADDPQSRARMEAFLQAMRQLGWTNGDNLRIETRWAPGRTDEITQYARELVALAPDIILATASPTVAALQATTRTVPIVFAHAVDPVGAGFVQSLARPGGNATGFVLFEYSIGAKMLELLKEVSPGLRRAAVLRDPVTAGGIGQFGAIQSVALSLGIEANPVDVRDPGHIERAVTAFAQSSSGGLVVTASPLATFHRELIIALAGRFKLPAIYSERFWVSDGGLISYGPYIVDQYRRAAAYVDRILRGDKPADLPVQAPTKYELAINLKTAKALGVTIPTSLLTRADEVIE
jgi:putative tryptophan/tyrosine transport system substrate-binding protein